MDISQQKRSYNIPDFKAEPSTSVIAEIAVRFVAFDNTVNSGLIYTAGTGIFITGNLIMTATHVIDDIFRKCEVNYSDNTCEVSAQVWIIQVLQNADYLLWEPVCLWSSKHIDINDKPSTAVGRVMEVYHEKRDSCRLPFPCYQTNFRADGGMSGGPVFNERGELCGLICSSVPAEDDQQEHSTFITSLWPLSGIILKNYKDEPSVMDLIKQGIIKATGHEKIIINGDKIFYKYR
jgi:S1-C subfamily serine protease